MPCKDWNNDWVAQLYDELGQDEQHRLADHLARCADCRATMAGLTRSREILQAATPPVPAVPRVVVLRPKSAWPGPWAFAAGAACAVAIFAMGLFAAPRPSGESPSSGLEPAAGIEADLRDELARLEDRFNDARVQDLEYLMRWINDSELRTGTWIDRQQNAINLLALRQDPQIREQ